MRFVVYGAGAVGGVIGGRLAEHGHDVALIARGAHYEAIRDKGLRIQSPDDDATLDIPVVDNPSQLDLTADDVIFLATKSQDTLGACPRLGPLAINGGPTSTHALLTGSPAVAMGNNAAALSNDQREVVLLRHFTELSYDELAVTTGVPVKTVKSRLYSARQRLAVLLAEQAVE